VTPAPRRHDAALVDDGATIDRIATHLRVLVEAIGPRPPGSPANRRATDHLRATLASAGLAVADQSFDVRWWEPGPARLALADGAIDVAPAPFGRPCDVRGRVLRLADDRQIAAASPGPDRILVLTGDLAAEPYFPIAFPFLELPDQRARLERLASLRPAAVVVVADRGGPYSMLEDGDLPFPYLIVGSEVGTRLLDDDLVSIAVGGAIHESTGRNIAARIGDGGPRVVLSAHVDSKVTTPGALDNAGGVATLLALAEAGLPKGPPIELVFFNGEDHYRAPGEVAWLAATDLADVALAINLDGAGAVGHDTTIAAMACPPAIEERVRAVVASRAGWSLAEPWYESDHAMLAMRGVPSLAITSARPEDGLLEIVHTARDTLDIVDPAILADVAAFLERWLREEATQTRSTAIATEPPPPRHSVASP
jgi:aminopeptidase YwaD